MAQSKKKIKCPSCDLNQTSLHDPKSSVPPTELTWIALIFQVAFWSNYAGRSNFKIASNANKVRPCINDHKLGKYCSIGSIRIILQNKVIGKTFSYIIKESTLQRINSIKQISANYLLCSRTPRFYYLRARCFPITYNIVLLSMIRLFFWWEAD